MRLIGKLHKKKEKNAKFVSFKEKALGFRHKSQQTFYSQHRRYLVFK